MNHKEAERKGLRVLAGPFDRSREEVALASGIASFIRATGGRAQSVTSESGAIYLYRPRLELETMKQTERRLKLAKLRG